MFFSTRFVVIFAVLVFSLIPAMSEAQEGRWLVIAGSWRADNPTVAFIAGTRVFDLQQNGMTAKIVTDSDYPGLANNVLAVVLGPMSKAEALRQLDKIKSLVPDAYIKESP